MTEPNQNSLAIQRGIPAKWGKISRGLCIFGGVIVIFAGLNLAGLQAQGDNSIIQSIANGMGYYFIGKGIFMIAISINLQSAIEALFRKEA